MIFFANFVIVNIKMIIDFSNFYSLFREKNIVLVTSTSFRYGKTFTVLVVSDVQIETLKIARRYLYPLAPQI